MKCKLFFLVFAVIFWVLQPGSTIAEPGNYIKTGAYGTRSGYHTVEIIEKGEDYLVLRAAFAEPVFIQDNTESGENTGFVRLRNGAGGPAPPGEPELPSFVIPVSMLPGTELELELLEIAPPESYRNILLRPGPTLLPTLRPGSKPPVPIYKQSESIYSSREIFPSRPVKLEGEVTMRELHAARIVVHPFRYIPAVRELRFNREIVFRITSVTGGLEGTLNSAGRFTPVANSDPFLSLYRMGTPNFSRDQIPTGKMREGSIGSPRVIPAATGEKPVAVKLAVTESGIYQVTRNELISAGVDPDIFDPQSISLLNRGEEVAILVEGEEDHSFDPGDRLIFYGEAGNSLFSDENIYWLLFSGSPGLRMDLRILPPGAAEPVDVFLERSMAEENRNYLSSYPGGEGKDHWFWEFLTAPDSLEFSMELYDFSAELESCSISVFLMGFTSMWETPDHAARVVINGSVAGDFEWDGQSEFDTTVSFPSSWLHQGGNDFSIVATGATSAPFDIFAIGNVTLDYGRQLRAVGDKLEFTYSSVDSVLYEIGGFSTGDIFLFDVTDGTKPTLIAGAQIEDVGDEFRLSFQDLPGSARSYVSLCSSAAASVDRITKRQAGAALKNPANRADYIIVTAGDILNAVGPLADHNEARGLETKTIDVEDVYDEFSHGLYDPIAIRYFVEYALTCWEKPAPSYLLLVGDATYDYKDYLGTGKRNYVPAHLFESIIYSTETASDNWYAAVLGDDPVPDIFVGRITAKDTLDVITAVNKTIAYNELDAAPEDEWLKRCLFVADNSDYAGQYSALCDSIIQYRLPQDYIPRRAYLDSIGIPGACRDRIVTEMDEGVLMTYYLGHGGIDNWAHENIFTSDDVSLLNNSDRLTVIVAMDCLNGWFHHVDDDYSIAEELMRRNPEGAASNWSTTGWTMTESVDELGRHLFDALFSGAYSSWGEVFAAAKYSYYLGLPYYVDLIEMYTQFGDPALDLKLTEPGSAGGIPGPAESRGLLRMSGVRHPKPR